jgi:hypothetical protein
MLPSSRGLARERLRRGLFALNRFGPAGAWRMTNLDHYLIRNGDDPGAPSINRPTAKTAWFAVREMQRDGAQNIVVFDRDGRVISTEELAARAARE